MQGSYTLLSCQDNNDYLKYLFFFKQIVPASSKRPSLKAADKNQSYILAIENGEIFIFSLLFSVSS